VAGGLEGVAYVAAATGQPECATQLFAAVHALRETTGLVLPAPGWEARQQVLDTLRSALGEAAYGELWSEGETMGLDEAIEVALAVGSPAQAPDSPPGAPGPPPGDDRLTRREREVAELLSRRLTNRQIAERLVITERTAENHVQRILGKLGLRSRRELAS
jgi:non-specific serine/threonine protein kinase